MLIFDVRIDFCARLCSLSRSSLQKYTDFDGYTQIWGFLCDQRCAKFGRDSNVESKVLTARVIFITINSSDRARLAADARIASKKTITEQARARGAARWQSGDLAEAQQPPVTEDEADKNVTKNSFIDHLNDSYEQEISDDDF